ncbi:MAG TPA: DUF72 domain-containing protein [Polyangia bacterium]|nr:DUF72 domain-containing protein [Polyangia bacterium]
MTGAVVRVGTAGWDYPDWRGVVYPAKRSKQRDELEYLSRFFDTVEVNASFYRPADPKAAAGWVRKVAGNPRFRFTAKLWRRFTHERSSAWTADEVRAARAAFDVLQDAGCLGAVLLQFPWSFKRDEASAEWLRDLLGAFSAFPLAVEVRHASWIAPTEPGSAQRSQRGRSKEPSEGPRPIDGDLASELEERGVGIVNVDQPMFRRSIAPAARVTGAIGYVRLHGRNYRDWFREKATRDERYDYLYTREELEPWVARIREIAARPQTREVYAVTNNHVIGKAPANGAMIESMLSGRKVRVPPALFARYREALEPFALPDPGDDGELFARGGRRAD